MTFVSYDDEPPLGGQGVELRGMRAALRERGHTVTTVSGRGDHGLRYPRVTGRAPLDFSLQLNRHPALISDHAADVVHALGGPGGVLLLRRLDVPLVYTANHTYRMGHGRASVKRLLAPLEARAYRNAALVLAISASTAAAVRDLGLSAGKVEVLAPGVDVPPPGDQPRDGARLLFAGRWEPEKGVLDAVLIMREVLAQRPEASAVVLGAGGLDAEVRDAAAGEPRIEVAGRVDDRRLAAEYGRAAVVLLPSRYEGLGLVALEAQAHGSVPLGYDVDGLRDAVGRAAQLVAPGDRGALARLCLDLIDNPQRCQELAEAGRASVLAEHSWAVVGRRLEQVYDAVRNG